MMIVLVASGIWALRHLPLDAIPDITNNQVQVVTVSPSLAPQEVEQFITYPVELAMANIPKTTEIRSVSRYGLSVITIVFEEDVPTLDARQYVKDQIDMAAEGIPPGFGKPELMPITTGLGEIYQYTLKVEEAYTGRYSPTDLRTIQDWLVKRQLAGIPGVVEVSSFGGFLKQYEVAIDPSRLSGLKLTINDVFNALERNNLNSGGSYIEKGPEAWYIRAEGLITDLDEIRKITIKGDGQTPVRLRDIADIRFGAAPRFGAMTKDGKGEAVGGICLMLKGANSFEVTANIEERVAKISSSLPEGISIEPYINRSELVGRTIKTVAKNLIEGGLIVIVVLVLLLGNLRAGLIVASVIPLAMLFALLMMNLFGVSANLMSLGAIDFGIVVDGAVIIVESVLFHLHHQSAKNSMKSHEDLVIDSSARIYKSAAFGVLIILVVFLPILSLQGVEGKMFKPMAQTVSFALIGALILSVTYVPMLTAMVLKQAKENPKALSERIMRWLKARYAHTLDWVLERKSFIFGTTFAAFVASVFIFTKLGSVFIPNLEEGDLAMQVSIPTGQSLSEMIRVTTHAEKVLMENFPEVREVVSKIGTAEVPTDPMPVEAADVMILLKPKEEWTSTDNREELVDMMKEKLAHIMGASFEFSQPIQLRFNELLSGSKTDIAIKIFGDDLEKLAELGEKTGELVKDIPGAADVKVEATQGMRFKTIRPNRTQLAFYGVDVADVNEIIQMAYAGGQAGTIYEGERRFELIVRLSEEDRQDFDLTRLRIKTSAGNSIPISALVDVQEVEGPSQISRDDTRRRITIGVNVRQRDIAGLVADIEAKLKKELNLPAGYSIAYGGDFENLQNASNRLMIAVPVALLLILALLYFTFRSVPYALLIFTAIPLSAIGGILALWTRGMPFSISAGVGFIALFGVAVLNGIVMVAHLNDLRKEKTDMNLRDIIMTGGGDRLRPVLMTAAVAALGFLPMALSTSAGAEVQKPLATVVIGGLISATALTLLVLPALYEWLHNRPKKQLKAGGVVTLALLLSTGLQAQTPLTLEQAISAAFENHPEVRNAKLGEEQARAISNRNVDLPSTQGTIQYGQMNAADQDLYWSVQQSLGSILEHIRRGQSTEVLKELRASETQLAEKHLTYLVSVAYDKWVCQSASYFAIQSELSNLEDFVRRVELMEQTGDISRLEAMTAKSKLTSYKSLFAQQSTALIDAENTLRLLTGIADEWQRDTAYIPLLEISGDTNLHASFTKQLELQNDFAMRQSKVEGAAYFPELSVGYFNQQIESVNGFQGFIFGVNFPIWAFSTQSRIQEAKIASEIQINSNNQELKRRKTELQTALEENRIYKEQLSGFGLNAFNESKALLKAANESLRIGEIDFYKYYEAVRTASELRLEYYKMINNYNFSILKIKYLNP